MGIVFVIATVQFAETNLAFGYRITYHAYPLRRLCLRETKYLFFGERENDRQL